LIISFKFLGIYLRPYMTKVVGRPMVCFYSIIQALTLVRGRHV